MVLKRTVLVGGAIVAALLAPNTASAASSKGCDGGGFTLRLADGSSVKPDFRGSIAASKLPAGTRVKAVGKYVTFDIDPASFATYDYAFTGAPNPLDQTGGRRIVLYAGKVPDHRGLTLTNAASIRLDKENLELSRTRSVRTSSTSTIRTSAPARATSCPTRTRPRPSAPASTSAPT
jgi:hypothetical protein